MSYHNLKTLSTRLKELANEGFQTDFIVREGELLSMESDSRYPPEKVLLVEEQRFEGNTDPGDSSILYLLETDEGERGTLINSYGAASNQEIDLFIDRTIKPENKYD